jgi:O-antigen biosynthesis protein WbqP
MYQGFFKRLLDICVALSSLVILLPVFVFIALTIKLTDPGPVIFTSIRTGRYGKSFNFYKFRSMPVSTAVVASDQLGTIQLTWLGRFLRRSNIDELPQLWNILVGDMSLIGPRPSLTNQHDLIELRLSSGALECRPGLTGLAQVNSFNGMSIEQKVEFDATYAKSIKLLSDIKIILKTFRYLTKPPPVY